MPEINVRDFMDREGYSAEMPIAEYFTVTVKFAKKAKWWQRKCEKPLCDGRRGHKGYHLNYRKGIETLLERWAGTPI